MDKGEIKWTVLCAICSNEVETCESSRLFEGGSKETGFRDQWKQEWSCCSSCFGGNLGKKWRRCWGIKKWESRGGKIRNNG